MAYHVTHRLGNDSALPVARFGELLDELDASDREHPDVSVTHESEWCLAVFPSGVVVLEHLEACDPAHAGPLDRSEILALMTLVAEGRIALVRAQPWIAGYPAGIG